MPYHSSQDFAKSTLSITPEPLFHAAVGCSGQIHYILNAFPLVQLPEGLQSGAPLGVHLFLVTVFQFLATFLLVNLNSSSHPFIPHLWAILSLLYPHPLNPPPTFPLLFIQNCYKVESKKVKHLKVNGEWRPLKQRLLVNSRRLKGEQLAPPFTAL